MSIRWVAAVGLWMVVVSPSRSMWFETLHEAECWVLAQ